MPLSNFRHIQCMLGGSILFVILPGSRNATARIHANSAAGHRRRRSAAAPPPPPVGPLFMRLNLPGIGLFRPLLVKINMDGRGRRQIAKEDYQKGSNGVRRKPRRHCKWEASAMRSLLLCVPCDICCCSRPVRGGCRQWKPM